MLRQESQTGWWLITHVDHARLAGAFAAHWGNDLFLPPEPRAHALHGISVHDDGWAARDASPQITRQGKPSAFSTELVGRYSAFEEIDLEDYLAVRERAVLLVAKEDAYAALLVSMHTYNLLSERADRSTIAPEQLPLLDAFLERQSRLQQELTARVQADDEFSAEDASKIRIRQNFHLLQATDNLSLLSCVNYAQPANLLHALPTRDGAARPIGVEHAGERHFRLSPYPLDVSPLSFSLTARHVEGKSFASAEELQQKFARADAVELSVTISAD